MSIEEARERIQPATMSREEAAVYLGLSPLTMDGWRSQGRGPAYVKLGKGPRARVSYRKQDLDAFIESKLIGGDAR